MRKLLATFLLVAATETAGAYTITDGSGGSIDPGLLDETLSRIADQFADPEAIQFRLLRSGNDALCGELNGKNAYGAYVGFTPFFNINISHHPPPPPAIDVSTWDQDARCD